MMGRKITSSSSNIKVDLVALVEIEMKGQSKKCSDLFANLLREVYLSGGVRKMDDAGPVGDITRKQKTAKGGSLRKERVEMTDDIPCWKDSDVE